MEKETLNILVRLKAIIQHVTQYDSIDVEAMSADLNVEKGLEEAVEGPVVDLVEGPVVKPLQHFLHLRLLMVLHQKVAAPNPGKIYLILEEVKCVPKVYLVNVLIKLVWFNTIIKRKN